MTLSLPYVSSVAATTLVFIDNRGTMKCRDMVLIREQCRYVEIVFEDDSK